MQTETLISQYILYLKTKKNLSLLSISSYQNDLLQWFNFTCNTNTSNISKSVPLFYEHLKKLQFTSSTIIRKLTSLNGFFKYLQLVKMVEHNPFDELRIPKQRAKIKRIPTKSEMSEIVTKGNRLRSDELLAFRDIIILELLYATGVRVSELINIKLSDIDFEKCRIRIHGKGGKTRYVVFHLAMNEALNKYISSVRTKLLNNKKQIHLSSNGYLLISKFGKKLSRQTIWQICKYATTTISSESGISPHSFRHSFASHLLQNGASLRHIQVLLGHSNITTTQIYTHLTEEQIKQEFTKAHQR